MTEYQYVVCFALSLTSIAVAGFASTVCKLQSRFTNMPCVRIRSTVLNAFRMQYQHNTWVEWHASSKFNRVRDAKPTCQIPNPMLYRCAKIRIRHLYMKRWIDVKWCVINLCFGPDRLKDEVKQLLILRIVVFCISSAYILRLSNHTHFRLLRSRLLFSIRRQYTYMFYSVQESTGWHLKNNTLWC